jgi:hypothetical protein
MTTLIMIKLNVKYTLSLHIKFFLSNLVQELDQLWQI